MPGEHRIALRAMPKAWLFSDKMEKFSADLTGEPHEFR